ncbi:MAG TPA: TlpA disulfide reductase family protein [Steroidobacteraceae bacterium]|nr:TlpA disulfide reductase family protein [Steroidobacteraceae bacterium]
MRLLAGGPRPLLRRWMSLLVVVAGLAMAVGRPAAAAAPALDLAAYRGKVVVVDFWASWCKPCRQSIPWLNEMRSRYAGRGLVIVGVNVDAERAAADRFLHQVPVDFELVFDPEGSLATRFGVKGMPSTFVFDRDGKLVDTHLGFRATQKTAREESLQRLLSTSAP